MHWLPIVFLIVAVVLLFLFVILSLSFMGLYLSELGLWLSWIPLSLTIIATPYLIEYVQGVHPRWDFFVLLVSCFLNIISYLRLMMPFYSVSFTNRRLKKAMISSLGEDYLTYIDPTIKSKFIKKVRFRFSQYFSGAHYKRIDKTIVTVNDLPYRTVDETAINLNVYHPREGTKYPIIVFVHGGGWMMGSKDEKQNIRLVKRLAYMGYTV
ncbi:MAG: alpha/beta hydrolase, partial [Candidatus Heimdallarchaeota archaeon]